MSVSVVHWEKPIDQTISETGKWCVRSFPVSEYLTACEQYMRHKWAGRMVYMRFKDKIQVSANLTQPIGDTP